MTTTTTHSSHSFDNSVVPIVILLSIWFGTALTFALSDAFKFNPDVLPINIVIAGLAPPLLLLAALRTSSSLAHWARALDPALLTTLQAWRIVGAVFVALLVFGQLPGLFAWPAGLGDVAVGVAAPLVVWRVMKDSAYVKTARYRWFHYLGLFDFVVAFTTGILASGQVPGLVGAVTSAPMGNLPLVMVPAFFVPAFACLHVLALHQARHA